MRQAQRASVRRHASARFADPGTMCRARGRTILAALLAVILALVTACGPGGVGNGGGIGDDNGNGTGGPGDAGGGQVADLGGEFGVTALIDGVRTTATENAWAWGSEEPSHFALMAHRGEDAADSYWVVMGRLVYGPQECNLAVPTYFGVQPPAADGGYLVALDCTIEVDAYELGEQVYGYGWLIAVTGRFAGTMREVHEDVGYVGPVRVVTNGVFDIALPEP